MIPIGDDTPTRKIPVVTWSLLLVNVAIFAICRAPGQESFDATLRAWGFTPARFGVMTLFTSMFLHANILHLVGNMLYLWIFGDNVEDILGRAGFLIYYFATGLAATLVHFAFNSASTIPTVGASGAISGVLGAYIVLFPGSRIKVIWLWYWYVRFFKIGAGWFIGLYFLMQFVLATIAKGHLGGVAYWAHLGGFATGLAATLVLVSLRTIELPWRAPPRKRMPPGGAGEGPAGRLEFEDRATLRQIGDGTVVASRAVDSAKLSGDASERIRQILSEISAGGADRAVELARLELRIPKKRAADPWQLARVADAFFQNGVHPIALHVYRDVLRRVDPEDTRIPEIKFRAGVIAARHVRELDIAREFLADAAKRHEDPKRRASAEHELRRIDANLTRTGISQDGALISGSCAVVRQTAGRVNVAEVGRIVSHISGMPMADATRLLRGSVGFVATGLEPMVAKRLAAQLQEMAIPVLVIPEEKLIALPAAREVTWTAVREKGFEVKLAEGAPVAKPWEDIYYAAVALVSFRSQKRVPDSSGTMGPRHYSGGVWGSSAGYGTDNVTWKYKETVDEKLVFDVFTLKPFGCCRLIDGKVDLRGSPQAVTQSSKLNFRRIVSDFMAHGRDVPVNDGVRLVAADAPRSEWRQFTFSSIQDFERYNYWRLQLEQYD